MKATVDQDRCAGCGLCVEICPQVFEMGDDDKSKVKVDNVLAEAEDCCRDAAEQCPQEAIQITEE